MADPSHLITQEDFHFSGLKTQDGQVECLQGRKNLRGRSVDEEQTQMQFSIYHITIPTKNNAEMK